MTLILTMTGIGGHAFRPNTVVLVHKVEQFHIEITTYFGSMD